MCRLFAFSFHKDTKKDSRTSFINLFKQLSITGSVLPLSTPGHSDGWGATFYHLGFVTPHHYTSVLPAHLDDAFESTTFLQSDIQQSGLVHLRKKTVGEALLINTHPFVHDEYSFIHNGTVSQTEVYPDLASLCSGETDSERLFKRFLEIKQNDTSTVKNAFMAMLKEVRGIYPAYSALNTILHDGNHIYVSRSVNLNSVKHKESDLLDYYSLFIGTRTQGDIIVSSEVVPDATTIYKQLDNHSVSIISIADGSVDTYYLD